jgi:hypothetical protein
MMAILTFLTVLTCASAWGQAFSIFDPAMQGPTPAPTSGAVNWSSYGTLVMHYDASAIAAIVGQQINSVEDLSPSGAYDLTSAFGPYWTNNPSEIMGSPWLQFRAGGSTYLRNPSTASITQPSTVFVVVKPPLQNCYIFDSGGDSARNAVYIGSLDKWTFYAGNLEVQSTSTVNESDWFIVSVRFSGATSTLKTNGVIAASGNVGTSAQKGLTIGARYNLANFGTMGLAKFLWYNGTMTTENEAAVIAQLNSIYGVY